MVGVNNLFPQVCEFILFLTLSFWSKYFVNDLLRITTILLLYFEYLDFKTNVYFYQKKFSSQVIGYEQLFVITYPK